MQAHGVVQNYKVNKNLRSFVRSYVGMAHVPPNRLDEAFSAVNKTYNFDDAKEMRFKVYLEHYLLAAQ